MWRPATNRDDIKKLLHTAVRNLSRNQPNLNDFTSETGQTEWNLAHHLANEISALLPEYDCDLDVMKRNFGNQRPDIILHERGNDRHNHLVIEIKRHGSRPEIDEDVRKIREDWFRLPLAYRFGALINLLHDEYSEIEVLVNNGAGEQV